MSKKSAGLLLFREASGAVEVLLVHPGGPFWSKKDEGAWSIPKGEFSDDEDPLNAAAREVKEELGEAVTAVLADALPIRYNRAFLEVLPAALVPRSRAEPAVSDSLLLA